MNPAEAGAGGREAWIEAPDGTRLYGRLWCAHGSSVDGAGGSGEPPHASILYLHGLGSHSGWFGPFARELARAGYRVLAPDLRGHGRSEWPRGEMPGPGVLLDDALHWLERLRAEEFGAASASAPFVMGTSLGGCLAVSTAARAFGSIGIRIAGALLFSPAFRPIYLSLAERIQMGVRLVVHPSARVATPLARGLPICGDEACMAELRSDPDSLDSLTVSSHFQASRLIGQARHLLPNLRAPLFVAQGGRDPVVSAKANRDLFESRSRTRFYWLEEAYHDLALEPGREQSLGRVVDWLQETRG